MYCLAVVISDISDVLASGILMTHLTHSLQWRHNGRDIVSNHQPHNCLLNCLFRRRSQKTSKLHVTGLCAGNSPGTGEFPAQMASNMENVSIWWRHHVRLSDEYGLSPVLCQAIIWTNAGILLIGPLGTNFSELLIRVHTFSFKKMHMKMSSAKWLEFCLGLNVLRKDYEYAANCL